MIIENDAVDVVIVNEDIRLDGAEEYVIRGVIVNPSSRGHPRMFCADVNNLLKRDVIAANEIVHSDEEGCIPIRIMTLSTETKTIFKGTRLGTTEAVTFPALIRSIGLGSGLLQRSPDVLKYFEGQLKNMPGEHVKWLKPILMEYCDVFSTSKMDIGCVAGVEHQILTGNTAPIALNSRRTPIALEEKVDNLVDALLEQKVIRPSHSPWNAPIVVAMKKNGDIRMCVDYRKLNAVTKRPVFPIPSATHLFDTLEGAKYFSSLDLSQGYYQVPMAEQDIKKRRLQLARGNLNF